MAAPEAAAELESMTRSFIEKVGYVGMGSVEYKWDNSSRRFLIIEPTVGRTDLQEEIATLCGVNIPLAAYKHELGEPCTPYTAPRVDVVWRSSFLERLKGVSADVPQHVTIHDGYWRLDDPLPALIRYSCGLCSSAWRSWRRRRSRLGRPEFGYAPSGTKRSRR
jgi:D-aspartate ligase